MLLFWGSDHCFGVRTTILGFALLLSSDHYFRLLTIILGFRLPLLCSDQSSRFRTVIPKGTIIIIMVYIYRVFWGSQSSALTCCPLFTNSAPSVRYSWQAGHWFRRTETSSRHLGQTQWVSFSTRCARASTVLHRSHCTHTESAYWLPRRRNRTAWR